MRKTEAEAIAKQVTRVTAALGSRNMREYGSLASGVSERLDAPMLSMLLSLKDA
jgi:hypothetical protein